MKLAIERAALLRSLAHVQSVVERRTTIPILSNVKLEAEAGGLALTATDMDLSVVERAEAEIAQPGATSAPAHTLYDVVRKLPEGCRINLERSASGAEITLRAGRSTFDLPCLPAADFPAMTDEGLDHSFGIEAGELRRLIDRTRFAISTEETRYYLNGIFLHAMQEGAAVGAPDRRGGGPLSQPTLRSVATDGHRLARVEAALPAGAEGMPPVIVPRKTVGEIRKLIDELETGAGVEVALSSARIRFKVGAAILRSRLIDGTFPDYQRVIPTGNDKLLVAPTKELSEAVDRVATIATDKGRAIKLSLADGRLTLSAISPDAGRAIEELDVQYAGEPLEIGFNARYILDMNSQIEGDEVEFAMADAGSPTLVRDPKDSSTLYVLMPMRV
ncbi:MAG TPA: DNA polymerase III subunit beta [Geminicoccaceae bacterium]|nr:DNA polymerase III subunit beta [Geminicoccaceae bacterium]